MIVTTIIAAIITIIGALNWLLVGVFDFNLVTAIFGAGTVGTSIVYIVVGIAGLWLLYYLIAMAVRQDSRSRRWENHHYDSGSKV